MRTTFLIDGFNFYHSIEKLQKKYRWINYQSFCSHFLESEDTLQDIYYFSAVATWRSAQSQQRHKVFIKAIENYGVKTIYGKFKKKHRQCPSRFKVKECETSAQSTPPKPKCPNCPQIFECHEEKATDVNIALYSYSLAHQNTYDKLVLVTGDTDLVPAIKMIKQVFPTKIIHMLYPYNRANHELTQVADGISKTVPAHLDTYQLPNSITLANGKIITRPPEWA